ncbi:MAG: InlB B-repeat-containing protein, partial [Fibrobacter sp.]|nr:InlB B-repeat-containing protein [Fibrobacter sp.]
YIEGKDNVGVFVGVNDNSSLTIANCFGAGYVKGNDYVAGFVGQSKGGLNIANSYSVSIVNGEDYTGGFIGSGALANVANSFFLNGVSNVGGTQKSADEFHDGTVATELHNWCEKEDGSEDCKEGGLNGSVWGQVAAPREDGSVDTWPVLVLDGSGKLVFSIAAELNGGSTKNAFATKYEYGTNYVLPIPERANYTFGGWFTDATFTEGSGITEIVSTDFGLKNVYAKWIPVKYTIKVSVNDKAMGTVAGAGEYEYGAKVEISAAAKKGYKFVKWSDGVKDAKRTITVTKAEKLTATFEKDSKKDAVVAMAQLPQFSVTASGKMVSIAGARPNSIVNVFDMQGNRVKTVVATAANFTFALPSAGVYIVKNGYTAKRVNVR